MNPTLFKIKLLTDIQRSFLNELWNKEYPVKLNNRFDLLLDDADYFDHYLISDEHNKIMGWAVAFEKENEVRFSIIVGSEYQGKGYGKLLIDSIKKDHDCFLGWVIDHDNDLKTDGTFYRSPMSFYLKQGFVILKDVRIDTEMISAVKIQWSRS